MKIFIRGGRWTNIEDQVLIAAYMKYGNNQWPRIASLLPRKSTQQVKARWDEYLNPRLKKTAWTQKEDEKLINFSKMFPNQWRTIANFFNRSAYQCLERYKTLVAKVTNTVHLDDNESAIEHQMMPNFETLSSTPDTVVLDTDAQEMLEEARARLSSTQGKKARRKARERQLEVRRKLGIMRKKKELEASGLTVDEKKTFEDEEYELQIIKTHSPKAVRFDTSETDALTRKERLERIQKKAQRAKKLKDDENLSKLKHKLKVEEERSELPSFDKRTHLQLDKPRIDSQELHLIAKISSVDRDSVFKKHSLSLYGFNIKIETRDDNDMNKESFVHDMSLPIPLPLSVKYIQNIKNIEDPIERSIQQELIRLVLKNKGKTEKDNCNTISPSLYSIENYFLSLPEPDYNRTHDAERIAKDDIMNLSIDHDLFSRIWDENYSYEGNYNIGRHCFNVIERNKEYDSLINSRSETILNEIEEIKQNIISKINSIYGLRREMTLYRNILNEEKITIQNREKCIEERVNLLKVESQEIEKEYENLFLQKKKLLKQRSLKN